MAIPANILFPFPGAHATAHTGWSRDTTLDSKYIHHLSAGDGGGTGGSASHLHTAPDVTVIQNAHSGHTVTTGLPQTVESELGSARAASSTHVHTGTLPSATATNQATPITINSTSNDPPYYTVIWKVSGGTNGLPSGFWAWFDAAAPSGWTAVDATNGKYLKGAATGADGGSTGGASNSHLHLIDSITVIQNPHNNADVTSSSVGTVIAAVPGGQFTGKAHTHVLVTANSTATNQPITPTVQNSNGEPAFDTLLLAENTSGGELETTGSIGAWPLARGDIPAGWAAYAFSGDFVKCTNSSGNIGTTGGSATHAHTSDAFTVIQNPHNHPVSSLPETTTTSSGDPPGAAIYAYAGHLHAGSTSSSTTATNNTETIVIANCSSKAAYPAYMEIILIKKSAVSARVCYLPIMGAG